MEHNAARSPRGVMVLCQLQNGLPHPAVPGLLGLGRTLCNALSEPLHAAVLGAEPSAACAALLAYPIDAVWSCEGEALRFYTAQSYADCAARAVRAANPRALLLAASDQGRDLAARLCAALNTGLTADCTELCAENGMILMGRPAYDGNVLAWICAQGGFPQMATVRPGIFAACPPRAKGVPAPRLIHLPAGWENAPARDVTVLSAAADALEADALLGAQIVVAGGRGMKNEAGCRLVAELAEALGASLGASRGAVEAGLMPYARQIGQTGKTVRPRLYIACGISGTAHHLAGVKAERILAVDRDPRAPIFDYADYAVCGALSDVLPALIERLKRR